MSWFRRFPFSLYPLPPSLHLTSLLSGLSLTLYAVTDPIFRSYPTRIPITHICSLIPFVTLFVFLSSSVMFCFLLFLMYVCIVSYHISWIFVLFCFLFVSGLVSSLVISTHIHLLNYSRVFSICFGFDLRYYCWGGSWKGFEVVTAIWRNEYGLRYALPMVCEMHASYTLLIDIFVSTLSPSRLLRFSLSQKFPRNYTYVCDLTCVEWARNSNRVFTLGAA